MGKRIDLEVVMTDIESIFKTNLPVFISDMNTEKGDTLLETFIPESYYVYDLAGAPSFKVAFYQSYDTPADVDSQYQNSAIKYIIRIAVIIGDRADDMQHIRIIRYNRVIRDIILNKITCNNPRIVGVDPAIITDKNGRRFNSSVTSFTVDIAE